MTFRSICVLCCAALAIAVLPANAQPGVWQSEAELIAEAGPEWARVAPGVWERSRTDGSYVRLGFGVEAYQWALDKALAERAVLAAEDSADPAVARRVEANRELIVFLRSSLEEAVREERGGSGLEAAVAPVQYEQDYVCNGTYTFDIQFTCGMSSGTTTTDASWTEFGPYAPYTKRLHTYASAQFESYGNTYFYEDEDDSGTFSHACCVSIQSQASAGPSFQTDLYGYAYLTVGNGCSAFRFIEANGAC